jgi:hypothetical protein
MQVYEKNISTKQYFKKKDPWISGPHGYEKRKARYQETPRQGA